MCGDEVEFVVDDRDAGKRADKFLSENFDDISRTQIGKAFADDLVSRNGAVIPGKYRVRAGDVLKFLPPARGRTAIVPVEMPLDILFEDEAIIAVDKPAGIVVHPGNGTVAATLVEGILAHCPLSSLGCGTRPGVVHRLDKGTTGVIVFAKTDAAYLKLVRTFASRAVKKTYQAIVEGVFPKNFGTVEAPVGRHRTMRTRMAVSSRGKEASTEWRVARSFGNHHTHLEVRILTGRTHQIRVHMAAIGHPVVGDATYGHGRHHPPIVVTDHQLLHASDIAFCHPIGGKLLAIHAPLPDDFSEALRTLELHGRCH
jgi:23S rRNA pseudouridine1911/1915/1917 synthase